MTDDPSDFADDAYCYLTTTGRNTAAPHTIEIWFAIDQGLIYLMAGGRDRSDWVRNLMAESRVTVRFRDRTWHADARVVEADTAEDARARRLLCDKYADADDDLVGWARTALPVALIVRA